jgi:hypothetical protein
MNRRELLTQLALAAGGTLVSAVAEAALRGAALHVPPAQSALQPLERELVRQLAELILPRTDTPGAIDAGVPAFIDQIVSNWYSPQEREIFREGLASLDVFCRQAWSRPFTECDPEQQTKALSAAEDSSRGYEETSGRRIRDVPDEQSPFFYKLKLLTVLGYYTSEVGSTQELSYDPVPGKYDGDLDFETVGRQWSW